MFKHPCRLIAAVLFSLMAAMLVAPAAVSAPATSAGLAPAPGKVKLVLHFTRTYYTDRGRIAGSVTSPDSSRDEFVCAGTTCTYWVWPGSVVSMDASAERPVSFHNWGGACRGRQSNCTITVRNSTTAVAFLRQYPWLWARPMWGNGTVTSTNGDINCTSFPQGYPQGDCQVVYPPGTTVTLTAIPSPGERFINWTGPCAERTNPVCVVTVTRNTKVSAFFSKVTT